MSAAQIPWPHPLELKVPPPVVALVIGALMWGASRLGAPLFGAYPGQQALAGALAALGFVLAASGALAFRRAQTTIHPNTPEKTTALVHTGVYRLTRNPMYLGLLLLLGAWALWLPAPWGWFGPVAFVPYISRFQIAPEERVLAGKFGAEYARYCLRVRRWL